MAELDEALRREIVDILRNAGAVFAFIHGSTARGGARADSDIDVAAWWSLIERSHREFSESLRHGR